MSFHHDLAGWLELSKRENCPVCNQEPMPEGMQDIELAYSWLCIERMDCLKGACHLVARQHALELYELDDAELLDFMHDVQRCAKALKAVTGAVKINYEIHGNTVPHLHMHLYPRYPDDPFPGQAIDYKQRRSWYTDEEFEGFIARMRDLIVQG